MGNQTHPSPTFPQYPGGAVAVSTVSDNTLAKISVIYVGGAGNVNVLTAQNDTVTFYGLNTGTIIPVQVVKVFSSGTTATNLVAIY